MSFFWAVLMLPLSLTERISALQCTSLFGVVALFYLVVSVVAHALLRMGGDTEEERHEWPSVGHGTHHGTAQGAGFHWPAGFELLSLSMRSFEAVAIIMFAFTCQVNVPSLYEELAHRRSPQTYGVVSRRAMGVCLGAYVLVGLFGYYDAPKSRNGNLLDNYCVVGPSEGARLMLPAFGAMLVTVLMSYPLNIHPCRYTLDIMACSSLGPNALRGPRHVGWTVLIAGSGLLIALYVPGINLVFQLMGSTSSAFVCFIMPAAFGITLRLPEASGRFGALAARLLFGGGIVIGIVATAVTTVGLFRPHGDHAHTSPCELLEG